MFFIMVCACLGQYHETPTAFPPTGGAAPTGVLHSDKVPDSTKAILRLVMPKVLLKGSTLPEVARYFERESKGLDPNHIGVRIVGLSPTDFGVAGENGVYVINFEAKDISIGQALLNAAQLFHMKLEIRKDIYIIPGFADFEGWEKTQILTLRTGDAQ